MTFSAATQTWLQHAFGSPTPAQVNAWDAIARGEHTLVVAPTGSGKTLAAFLSALDRLATEPVPPDRLHRCRVLYVSPLKALAVDVERNLRAPLAGIQRHATELGLPRPNVTVSMRTGDTPAEERRAFARRPADILITTPESLFLLLTSAAHEALQGIDTVIVDEVHAVCATKRGAHLAVSLERLDALLERPAQRIGLSATVRPVDEVATFLGGTDQDGRPRPVTVVQPPSAKTIELQVVVPVEDLSALGQDGTVEDPEERSSIWPHVEERVFDLVSAHRSTIVFANSRRLAERLTARLNEIADERGGAALPPADRVPAQYIAQSGSAHVNPQRVVARAHHGSVSREQRKLVEEDLKSGRLPAVVATSSLELGIDMGAVDLVVQVESPPSVAAGLQRVGRAGHHVGEVSRGVIFPKFRGDLLECAVVAERMGAGLIEAIRYPRNPLDVLAQQIVATVAMHDVTVDELAALVRRAAPFAQLPKSALESVLDMLAGRYPSDAFAELHPRLVWDRVTGKLSARAGAQRLAVTSGGTIPDRGLFGVFLLGEGAGRRVGELDEEMVYESRVGDVFLLGSSSWRIEDITHDRVIVTPAPGLPGRMPFWKGDQPGRPVELGRAVGQFCREVDSSEHEAALARATEAGLDEWGTSNLLAYLADQRAATGRLPDDRTIIVERCRDELGDWRLIVHSPFGAPVNAPWALAMGARLRERYGFATTDLTTMHSDDGIVLRLPDLAGPPPGADLVAFGAEEITALVASEVGSSALFAARFRECAARALLLPKRDPRRRAALWQQRQRATQLLQIAAQHGDFPIVLEAMRECLQDVFDLPGLAELMRALGSHEVDLIEVETPTASPFARSLLFGYLGTFIYDGDAPLAERRAQALALDTSLLAELLGTTDLRDLLDPSAIAQVTIEVSRLNAERRCAGVDAVHDLLRVLGDLTTDEALARGATATDLAALQDQHRVIRARIGGEERWLAVEDAARVRDALAVPLPDDIPAAFLEPVQSPLADLVARFARTHGPFTTAQVAQRLGLGFAVAQAALARLVLDGRVTQGEFTADATGLQWCGVDVLQQIRRRSLAALRRQVEPAEPVALARFLPAWQGVTGATRRKGTDGLMRVIEQLAGVPIPASTLESQVLPARIMDYSPALLDELTLSGEVSWTGAGTLGSRDLWMVVAPTEVAPLLLPPTTAAEGPIEEALLDALNGDQALFFRSLSAAAGTDVSENELAEAVWRLVRAGQLTNDTLAPVRALLGASGRTRAAPPRRAGRYGGLSGLRPASAVPAGMGGRWSATPAREGDPTRRAVAVAEAALSRHGVLTRGAVASEGVAGGFAGLYPVLAAAEESGRIRRGYFVDGLGAAQFALPGAVDRIRSLTRPADAEQRAREPSLVLAATDPANPYGAALSWPGASGTGQHGRGHQPSRKAGALVVLVDGECALYVERGGRTLLSFTEQAHVLQPAADALALAVREGALGRLHVERADGAAIADTPLGAVLTTAGFRATPRGLRLRS